MTHSCFDVDVDKGVARLTLSRPEALNTMTPEFWDELPRIVAELDRDGDVRVLVIASTGRHFTAGMDLSVFQGNGLLEGSQGQGNRGVAFYDLVRRLQHSFSCLEQARFPVLAAIQGGCIGGGVDLVTACDMRYATRDAFFSIYEINIGMTADVGTFPRITRLIPEGVARELAYTGRRMPADRAQAVGLVNDVYADSETMLAEVLEIAREIAAKAPVAVYGTKRMLNYARDHSTADALDYVGIWNASMLAPEQMAEAFAARTEKREPRFPGLPKRTT